MPNPNCAVPGGVSWQALYGDIVVCIDDDFTQPVKNKSISVGMAYAVDRHNRDEGFITVRNNFGELESFFDRRFRPAGPADKRPEPKKNDQDKPRMDIVLSIHGIERVGNVFAHGAKKYDEFNWRKGGNSESFKRRMAAAAVRHITSYLQGTQTDDESKEPHLAHAIADLLMILDLEETK